MLQGFQRKTAFKLDLKTWITIANVCLSCCIRSQNPFLLKCEKETFEAVSSSVKCASYTKWVIVQQTLIQIVHWLRELRPSVWNKTKRYGLEFHLNVLLAQWKSAGIETKNQTVFVRFYLYLFKHCIFHIRTRVEKNT